ncbi:MAG: hypothetical protein R2712_08870 [Vicinamibacterales bacterium]
MAIICRTTKGHGALSDSLNKHKVTVPDAVLEQEMSSSASGGGSASWSSAGSIDRSTIIPAGVSTRQPSLTPRAG